MQFSSLTACCPRCLQKLHYSPGYHQTECPYKISLVPQLLHPLFVVPILCSCSQKIGHFVISGPRSHIEQWRIDDELFMNVQQQLNDIMQTQFIPLIERMGDILRRVSGLENRLIEVDGDIRKVFKLTNDADEKNGKQKSESNNIQSSLK